MKNIYLIFEWLGAFDETRNTVLSVFTKIQESLGAPDADCMVYDPDKRMYLDFNRFCKNENLIQSRTVIIQFVFNGSVLQSWTVQFVVDDSVSLFGVMDYQLDGSRASVSELCKSLRDIFGLSVSCP